MIMKAEELEKMFVKKDEDFASSFNFEDDRAWVSSVKGILCDECLDLSDGSIIINMSGSAIRYATLDEAIDELFLWWSQDVIEYIIDEDCPGLQIVSTTSERNGYPKYVKRAIIGCSYEQLKEISNRYKNRLEIVNLYRKCGWDLWYRNGFAYSDYKLDPEKDFNGSDTILFEPNIEELKGFINNLDNAEDIKIAVENWLECKSEYENKADDEMVVCDCNLKYITTSKKSVSFYKCDSQEHTIGLIEI